MYCRFFPPECLNYTAITTQNGRKNTYVSTKAFCDNDLFGWHRFEAATGTKMPTSCVPKDRCNTRASGWLNGDHPTVAEGLVTRQVCFSFNDCCSWSINIQVRNCGDFFIFNFMGTPPENPCFLRYCSTDWTLTDRLPAMDKKKIPRSLTSDDAHKVNFVKIRGLSGYSMRADGESLSLN